MLRKISLPAWAALVLALFLVLLVVTAWLIFSLNPSHVPWRTAMSWTRIVSVLVLLVLTPLVFYWTIRYWLVGYQARYPDIDHAWRAGVEILERNGIFPQTVPIFLVLGSPSPELERSLMDACGTEFAVRGVPEGPAPLHWYGNTDRIYLVCSEVGWLSRLNREVEQAQAAKSGAVSAASVTEA
jgi:hypothetical protein